MDSMGLSLSDQYWARPAGSDVSWEDVNFFDNPFSEDVGDLLFGHEIRFGELNLSSPDNTTEGNLKKRWKNLDGRGCLIKTGSNMTFQEPFNEVAASILMTAGGIPHTDYRLIYDDGMPCCVCEDFVNRNTELVTAHSALSSSDTPWESVLDAYLGICDISGLDITADIDRMIALDHIIANTDRHLNNFGIIRDAETLEWLSAAPIYDSGSSLGYDVPADEISSESITSCKPFSNTFRKQIRLASSLESVDLDGMRRALPEVEYVYTVVKDGVRQETMTVEYEEEENEKELVMTISKGGRTEELTFEDELENGMRVINVEGTLDGERVQFRIYVTENGYDYVFPGDPRP